MTYNVLLLFCPLKYFYDLLYVCAAQSKHASKVGEGEEEEQEQALCAFCRGQSIIANYNLAHNKAKKRIKGQEKCKSYFEKIK